MMPVRGGRAADTERRIAVHREAVKRNAPCAMQTGHGPKAASARPDTAAGTRRQSRTARTARAHARYAEMRNAAPSCGGKCAERKDCPYQGSVCQDDLMLVLLTVLLAGEKNTGDLIIIFALLLGIR